MKTRVALLLVLFAGTAVAKPTAKPAPPPPPDAKATPAHVSALAHVASEVVAGLGAVPAGTLVAVSLPATDIPAPRGEELAVRIAALVASKLAGKAHPQAASLAVARGAAGRAGSLVYVQLEITKGALNATVDLYPVVSNGWERLRNPAPGPKAHAFVTSPLDAEIRTYLQPIVLEQASVHKAKLDEADVVAIGCGDVDADGGLEIGLATRSRVVLGNLRGGKFAVLRATPWSQLAPRLPVPLREPVGSIVLAPQPHPGELFVGTTDRGGVALDAMLGLRRPLTGIPIPGADGDACMAPEPAANAFSAGIACVPPSKGDPAVVLPATRFDAIAALSLVGKDGIVTDVSAARDPGGKVRLHRSDVAKELALDGAGAQLALADLDLDGTAEIAVSGDPAEGDSLTIYSWRNNGLAQRLKLPTKEPVRALAACPPEERGLPALVAVVGNEVWLVR